MFKIKPDITFENNLGKAMLLESSTNDSIKGNLQSMADVLLERVLQPIKKAVQSARDLSEVDQAYKNAIITLAGMHSNEEQQYGGLLRNKYDKGVDITKDMNTVHELLEALEQTLTNIKNTANTPDQMAKVIKVMVDLGFSYVERLPNLHADQTAYLKTYNMIWPSPEEMNARILRTDVGDKQPKVGTELGIGTSDLISKNSPQSGSTLYGSGKAVFAGVDMEERLKLTANKFDVVYKALKDARETNGDIKNAQLAYDVFLEAEKNKFGSQWVAKFVDLKDSAGGVVGAFSRMDEVDFKKFAKIFEPSAIKLARNTKSPLVASVSGSTARLEIALQDLGGYTTNGKFDPDKAQILANCIGAFFNQGGHHSVMEVAETYNRLIDLNILEPEENLPESFKIAIQKADKEPAEKALPYFRYGDPSSFLHQSYKDSVMEKVKKSGAVVPESAQKENIDASDSISITKKI